MEDIKIAKKHCTYQENAYSSSYSIPLPKTSQYKGYTVTVPPHIVGEHGEFYAIVRPWKEDFTFTLVKTEREYGKRYARPKLSFDELAQAMKEYDDAFDLSRLPRALVKFNEYSYSRNGVEEDRNTRFCVGYVKGKWFYEENYERHLISAKHFTLLKDDLTEQEAEAYADKIKCLSKWTYQIEHIKKNKTKVKDALADFIKPLTSYNLTESIANVIENIDTELVELEQAVKNLSAFFDSLEDKGRKIFHLEDKQ